MTTLQGWGSLEDRVGVWVEHQQAAAAEAHREQRRVVERQHLWRSRIDQQVSDTITALRAVGQVSLAGVVTDIWDAGDGGLYPHQLWPALEQLARLARRLEGDGQATQELLEGLVADGLRGGGVTQVAVLYRMARLLA